MSKRWILGGVMLALVAAAPMLSLSVRAEARPVLRADEDHSGLVELVMSDGRVIKAEILEETPTEYRVMAYLMEGFPAVETTYRKSAVSEVRKIAGQPSEGQSDAKAADAPKTTKPGDAAKAPSDAVQIVLTRVDGQVGFDFSPTPLRKFFDMVDKQFDDLDAAGNVKSEHRQDHVVVFRWNTETNVNQGLDGMFSIMAIKNILHDEINKGRRIVFWVQKGLNGAAVLPMMSKEIYFMDRGILYVTDDLEDFQFGDPVVREKQISLRQGHAEGFPLLGGYNDVGPAAVRAMVRRSYPFWYKKVGDRVYGTTDEPRGEDADQWIQLSDDGKNDNKDDPDDITTVLGNDRLWIDTDRAYELGFSKGVANNLDDLAFQMGVGRNYTQVLEDQGEELFHRWRNELERALGQVHQGNQERPRGELWRDFDKAARLDTPQKQFGAQKNALEKIVRYLTKYEEVLDPDRQMRAQLEIQIELLKQRIIQANRQGN